MFMKKKEKNTLGIQKIQEHQSIGVEYKDFHGYIERKFDQRDSFNVVESGKIYGMDGNKLSIESATSAALPVMIMNLNKKVEGMTFDKSSGELTIKNQNLENVRFHNEYFKAQNTIINFLYEKEENEFHPVKFILKNNRIKDFDMPAFESDGRCFAEDNLFTGIISGFHFRGNKYHNELFEKNKIGDEIGFKGCFFIDYTLENKTITKMSNTSAGRILIFKNCLIKETDFFFDKCPLVQFLEKNSIEKITNIYRVNSYGSGYLYDEKTFRGVHEIYFSNDTDIVGDFHSAEEKQYFF